MFKKAWLMPLSYTFLGTILVFILLTHPPVIGYDTQSYLNLNSTRPPLYPIFIWLFKWCGTYQLEAVTWVKTIIFAASLYYARNWLRNNLMLSDFLIFIVFCFTTITTFRLVLLAESLTVPLFVMAFLTAVDVMKEVQTKKLIWLSIWIGLLILARTQFYYLYLFFLWLIFWYLWNNIPKNNVIKAATIFSFSIFLTFIFNQTYHHITHPQTDCYISAENLLIMQPLYLADMTAINYFKDPSQKEYITHILTQMKKQKLTSADIPLNPPFPDDVYTFYGYNYNDISTINCSYLNQKYPNLSERNRLMMSAIKILYADDFKKNLHFFIWKYASFVGSIPLSFAFLILICAASSRIMKRQNKYNTEQIFVIVSIVLILSNNACIALFEPGITRYFFYNYFIYYCLAALSADRLFFHTQNMGEFQHSD